MSGLVYVVPANIATVTAAKTLLQIKAGASTPLELIRAEVSNSTSEVSDTGEIQILEKTAAATVTSFTPVPYNRGLGPTAKAVGGTTATGHTATAEGTDGDILYNRGFNVLNGHVWLPTPKERIVIDPGVIVALKSAITITSVTLIALLVFEELG